MLRSKVSIDERISSLEQALEILNESSTDNKTYTEANSIVAKTKTRLRHGTNFTLIAFLGPTGAGKSSSVNAVVGEQIAQTGIRRPTTSEIQAVVWGNESPDSLFEWLEVATSHQIATEDDHRLSGLVLLDVPDHDSIEQANRLEMERIAKLVDVMVWITDAEKYADKAMHSYLRELSEYGANLGMVLNKVDILSDADAKACEADLQKLLVSENLGDVTVIKSSALTPQGADNIVDFLAKKVNDKNVSLERLAADVRNTSSELLTSSGVSSSSSSKFDRKLKAKLTNSLVDASGLDPVCDAVEKGHKRDAAARLGLPYTRWVRKLRPHPLKRLHLDKGSQGRSTLATPNGSQTARVKAVVRDTVGEASKDVSSVWRQRVKDAGTPDPKLMTDRLDLAVSRTAREYGSKNPRWWAVLNALQVLLAICLGIGLLWLAVIAVFSYFRLPAPPLPKYRDVPIPTGLVIGGILIGLLTWFISTQFARLGAKRRRRIVRKKAFAEVSEVAEELIVEPVEHELEKGSELARLLQKAGE